MEKTLSYTFTYAHRVFMVKPVEIENETYLQIDYKTAKGIKRYLHPCESKEQAHDWILALNTQDAREYLGLTAITCALQQNIDNKQHNTIPQ